MRILSEEESKRINILKFTSIMLVVYYHCYAVTELYLDGGDSMYIPKGGQWLINELVQLLPECSIPIFYLISAIIFFSSKKRYGIVIRTKMKTLLLPYLFWNTFWIAVFIVLQSVPVTAQFFSASVTPILQYSFKEWAGLYGLGEMYPQCYPLWFVRDLLVVMLVSPLIKKAVDKQPVIMLGAGIILTVYPFDFFCKIALSWFIVGAAIVKIRLSFAWLDHISMKQLCWVYAIGAILTLLCDSGISRGIFSWIGIIFWVRLSKEIYVRERIKRIILWLSQWTFMICVFHELTLSCVCKFCFIFLPTDIIYLGIEYALIPVVVVILCILVGIIFRRSMPNLYRLSMGAR